MCGIRIFKKIPVLQMIMKNNKDLFETLRNLIFKSCSVGLTRKTDVFRLTFTQRSAIIFLSRRKEVNMRTLGDLLCLSKPAMTHVTDSLERKGYVKRVQSASGDRREYNIILTDKSKAILGKIDQDGMAVLDKIMASCSPSDRELYYNAFTKFVAKLDEFKCKAE